MVIMDETELEFRRTLLIYIRQRRIPSESTEKYILGNAACIPLGN